MSRKFLPPGQFGIPSPRTGDFTRADADLLHRIGSQMHVKEARTEGRVPTPISRAFTFYADLFNRGLYDDHAAPAGDGAPAVAPGRTDLQAEARRTFRGMLAVFALRETLGLQIAPESISLSPQADALSSVLVPALSTAPGGAGFWNPVRLYTVREGSGPTEALAGRSPLTGFFPPAKAPRALRGLYWYAPPELLSGKENEWTRARWQDPTGEHFGTAADPLPIAPATKTKVRQLVKAWLDTVLLRVTTAELQGYGFQPRDAASFLKELNTWQGELAHTPRPQQSVQVESAPMLPQAEELPALSFVVRGATADGLLSDLPEQDGRLIVTGSDLRNSARRLYGRTFGHSSFGEALIASLPAYGDNLGQALRLGPTAIPRPYVLVDRLFAPRLAVLTDGELSAEWSGMAVDMGGVTERALFPFLPEILTLIPGAELEGRTRAALTATNDRVAVRLQFGESEVVQHYSLTGDGAYLFDTEEAGGPGRDTVDLRVFPDFDLGSVDKLGLDATDTKYYARVRLLPSWSFHVRPFARDAAGGIALGIGREQTHGTFQAPDAQHFAEGKATFFEFDTKPEGFYFTDRGFCLLRLKPSPHAGEGKTPGLWDIGVDFGTSNTCVSFRRDGAQEPEILSFPVMTTTLLAQPRYVSDGDAREGGAALLDFFYRRDHRDEMLTAANYFPTQLLTRQQRIGLNAGFEIQNGLIQFYNVSSGDRIVWSLIESYPEIKTRDSTRSLKQSFRSVSDIKWEDDQWLHTFMHHLRKQVVLTAAHRNAKIRQVVFSYPKAFGYGQKESFEDRIDQVWTSVGSKPVLLISESEALRNIAVENRSGSVVFDIGGGTSDLIAFADEAPVFQTSFKLAAGLVNQYVIDSQVFRRDFLSTFNTVVDSGDGLDSALSEAFKIDHSAIGSSKSADKSPVLQIWLGMLETLSKDETQFNRVFNKLRHDAKIGDAVYGFFITLTILFCGLPYLAGMLMDMASHGRFGKTVNIREVKLRLAGNGSRLYRLLSGRRHPFEPIMIDLFERGYSIDAPRVRFSGVEQRDGKEAPKVAVALGLLSGDPTKLGHQVGELPIPVANVLGEEGYMNVTENPLSPEDNLVSFYQNLHAQPDDFHIPEQAPPRLRAFLNALSDVLPYGQNGDFPVIPSASDSWAEEMITVLYPLSIQCIEDRVLMRNAKMASEMKGGRPGHEQALEPLFVVELAALLDVVREKYANV